MFVLGGLLCALFGALEDGFEQTARWVVRKIRSREVAASPAAGNKE